MSEPIVVATPFSELGELAEHFAQRVDGGRLMLPYPSAVDEGQWAQFQVLYADGSVALEGTGKVSGAYDNGEEHPPEYRFDIVIEELSLDGTSEVVFERIVVARESMMAAEPGTGEVAIGELEAQVASPSQAPQAAEEEAFDAGGFDGGSLDAGSLDAGSLDADGFDAGSEAVEDAGIPEPISGLDAMESSSGLLDAEEAELDGGGFVEASTTVGSFESVSVATPPRRAAPAVAPAAAAPVAAPRANPRGAQPAPGNLPTPHSFAQGVLTRPMLDPAWAPTPDARPDPAASSGLFDYPMATGGKNVLPTPALPPRPELPAEARVGHAPAPAPAG